MGNKSESIFLKCQCGGCSLLEINCDNNKQWKTNPQFNITLWKTHPGVRSMPKKERIRWCSEVMKTGNPWADHTIISETDALKLAKFILKHFNSHKSNGKTKR